MSQTDSYTVRIAPSPDGSGDPDRVPDLSPREAWERWLAKLRGSLADSSVSSYHYRTKHFIEWCEDRGIVSMDELTGWDIDSFEADRRDQGVKTISLNNELGTLEDFFEYCARIELVDESLPEKVEPPKVPTSKQVNDTRLTPSDAEALLDYYRNSPTEHASRAHVLLALAWYTGARLGALRGLDVEDFNHDEAALEFHHRPREETPLKNGLDGERIVGIPDHVADLVEEYVRQHRLETFDDYGRRPLLTSQLGRGSKNGVRGWMYLATIPCLHSPCPHGNDPETCEFTDYTTASKCPSSRSPHQVRTGSVTWQLNREIPPERVSERVNTSIETLLRHYDQADKLEAMRERRRDYIDDLEFDGQDGDSE